MEQIAVHQILEPDDIVRLRDSFAALIPDSEKAADIFYTDLFQRAPHVRALFTTDPFEQGQKFMMMLAAIVDGLTRPEKLVADCQALGRRHVGYGVKAEHFNVVGESLIYALERVLNEKFTPEIRISWVKLYRLVSNCMNEEA